MMMRTPARSCSILINDDNRPGAGPWIIMPKWLGRRPLFGVVFLLPDPVQQPRKSALVSNDHRLIHHMHFARGSTD